MSKYPTREERAYCAGLFEGRGSISFSQINREGKHPTRRLSFSITLKDKESLELFRSIMEFGHIRRHASDFHYTYSTSGLERIQFIICNIWPWIGEDRKKQIKYAITKYTEFKILNPDRSRVMWRKR